MGIIGRQGLKKTIINYIGVLIGVASTLYIYPLEEAMYGLARFLLSMSILLIPLLTFGTNSLVIRFFPAFKDEETGHHGFLGFLLFVSFVCYVILGTLLYLCRDQFYNILQSINMDKDVFSSNLLEIGILVFLISSITIFTTYISNFKRIVIPGIFNSIYLKIGLPILILLFYFRIIEIPEFKWGLITIHALILLSLVIYTYNLGELYIKPNFNFISKKILIKMSEYSFHGVFASLGSTVAFKIDTIMTASLLGFTSTGVFSIADNIAGIIASPYLSIKEISAPIVAQNLHVGKYDIVNKLYQSTSIALLVIGLGLLITVFVSIDAIFSLSTQHDVLLQGKNVVLLLGMAKVVDMSAGLNNHIISYTSLYRWNIVLVLFLAVCNIAFNFTFIPQYGITGAALATFLSLTIFNLAKLIFVWIRFRMQPFTIRHIWVLVIGALAYFIGFAIPDTGYTLLNIGLKSGITLLTFGGFIIYFNFSPDINAMANTLFARTLQYLKIK